ncbi:MAG: hypothetical protein JKX76_01185 [Colwellia sp.]|nr:hypothetical protein [Colwellia sp.]
MSSSLTTLALDHIEIINNTPEFLTTIQTIRNGGFINKIDVDNSPDDEDGSLGIVIWTPELRDLVRSWYNLAEIVDSTMDLTVYRVLKLPKKTIKNGKIEMMLPFSTSFNLRFSVDWAQHNNRSLLMIKVPKNTKYTILDPPGEGDEEVILPPLKLKINDIKKIRIGNKMKSVLMVEIESIM